MLRLVNMKSRICFDDESLTVDCSTNRRRNNSISPSFIHIHYIDSNQSICIHMGYLFSSTSGQDIACMIQYSVEDWTQTKLHILFFGLYYSLLWDWSENCVQDYYLPQLSVWSKVDYVKFFQI